MSVKISQVEFRDAQGKRLLSRGVSVIQSAAEFREAVVLAFGQLHVDELFVQLGVVDDPLTYSERVKEELFGAFLELVAEEPEIAKRSLVKIVDPLGNLVFNCSAGRAIENWGKGS